MRLLLIASLLFACAEDTGDGRVVGWLTVPDCEGSKALSKTCDGDLSTCEAFDLEVDVFALESSGDLAIIRLQRGGRTFARTDGLILELRDVRQLRGNLNQRQRVGPNEDVRAALGLFDTCPDATLNFELSGEIQFTKFGLARGDVIAGEIISLEVRDGRAEGAADILGQLRGDFDFTVRSGPPYQQFVEQ